MNPFDFLKLIKEKTNCKSYNIAEQIYEKLTNKSYIDSNANETIDNSIIKKFDDIYINKPDYPYEYILGYIKSFDKIITVNENVLIPRQETEYLIDLIIKENINKKNLNILDICTGSGYIAICLSCLNYKAITATDISSLAIETAKHNSKINNVDIRFINCSYIDEVKNEGKLYDIITCNPPYIEPTDDYGHEIKYEPDIALFTNNTIEPYRIVLKDLHKVLSKNGIAYFETSSLHHNRYKLLEDEFKCFKFSFVKDNSNKYRYMIVKFA